MSDGGLGAPAQRNDPGTFRVGSIGGVDVLVRTSWFLVTLLVAYLVAPRIEGAAPHLEGTLVYVAGIAFALLLALSLLLHEISHALMAKRFGIPVRSITLHFLGGVTAIEGEPANPRQELAISAVGPVTSLGIGGVAFALYQVMPDGLLSFVVGGLAWVNIVVGVLNLVPGLPLDGGRMLRAAVWQVSGNPHTGTTAAGWAGRVVAVLVLFSPAIMEARGMRTDVLDYVFAGILGYFLWSAATAALVSAKVRSRLPSLQARRLARRTLAVPEGLPLAEAVRRAREDQAGSIVTVDEHGRPVGLVNESAVLATPEERRPWIAVSTVSKALTPDLSLPADLAGEELVRSLGPTPSPEYLLVEPDGSVYGVLVTKDVDAAFSARR